MSKMQRTIPTSPKFAEMTWDKSKVPSVMADKRSMLHRDRSLPFFFSFSPLLTHFIFKTTNSAPNAKRSESCGFFLIDYLTIFNDTSSRSESYSPKIFVSAFHSDLEFDFSNHQSPLRIAFLCSKYFLNGIIKKMHPSIQFINKVASKGLG